MGLFQKPTQRVTLYSDEQDNLSAFVALLKAEKIKGAKVSAITHSDGEWYSVVHCEDAEAVYYGQILPLLYSSTETQSFKVALELDDRSEPARRCPKEVLASFQLGSGYAFGDKAEIAFIQNLRKGIVQGVYVDPATVSYYIVSGGAVTMSIPCLDALGMENSLRN